MRHDIVHDLRLEQGMAVLRLMWVATGRYLSHDEAAALTDIPDLFIPVTAPGSLVAVWQTPRQAGMPIRALGAITDAGYHAIEDIDRLQVLLDAEENERKEKALRDLVAAFAGRLDTLASSQRSRLLPSPAAQVAAFAAAAERRRREALAIQKTEVLMRS